jgi:copper chaperone CopZ
MATTKTTTLRSQELSCPSCISKIERALEQLEGVDDAEVHFATGRIVVKHDPAIAKPADLVSAVGEAGYTAKVSAF